MTLVFSFHGAAGNFSSLDFVYFFSGEILSVYFLLAWRPNFGSFEEEQFFLCSPFKMLIA